MNPKIKFKNTAHINVSGILKIVEKPAEVMSHEPPTTDMCEINLDLRIYPKAAIQC